jgi:lipoprotein-anchoring transpeptidase ErfK/SrfK
MTANVVAKDGSPSVATSSFSTMTPAHKLTARVAPLNGATVGVGHPIALYLSKAVTDRAAVERRLTVTTDPPVAGSWLWVTDSQLRWRPAQYWQAHTKVTFDAALAGVDFGGGTWGVESRNVSFKIGDSHISVVDASTYKMTVSTNGVLEREIPVSLGRAKYPTKSGVHVVMDKERTTIMDSASIGVPAGSSESYRTKVEWATRISNSGEFVHSAPWSVRDQGRRHVSHGCVNVSPANAKWFFNYSQLGDVVEVKGTPEQIDGMNGFGDWNVAYPPPV